MLSETETDVMLEHHRVSREKRDGVWENFFGNEFPHEKFFTIFRELYLARNGVGACSLFEQTRIASTTEYHNLITQAIEAEFIVKDESEYDINSVVLKPTEELRILMDRYAEFLHQDLVRLTTKLSAANSNTL